MITRRGFVTSVGMSAVASTASHFALAEPQELSFPAGFRWGCATSSYQIEGAVKEDGRGASIWDTFSHTPGKIADGSNGDIACDSYHRYQDDTQLLKSLGANAYRFSIAWPRIFPNGRGKPNKKGVDHYNRVVDNLLENGIEPHITLFHWDLPEALLGGWQSRDTAKAFADYAALMSRQLSDRVKHFLTMNEFRSFVDAGHLFGIHAPGLRLPIAEVNQIRHHALLAHGLGVQALRANARHDIEIGVAENPSPPVPVIETEEHIAAARAAIRGSSGPHLAAMLEGRYPEDRLVPSARPPKIEPGDMEIIGSPLDFVALNVYTPIYVKAASNSQGYITVPRPASFPTMSLPWLMVGPEAIYWAVRLTSEVWKPRAIYISENGCSADDVLRGGRVDDTDRVMFLRNYLFNLRRAITDGYPLKGYFLWSLMDNFEWAEGYSKRFGIHYVDFQSQQRTPKLSAAWYREVIKRNGLA